MTCEITHSELKAVRQVITDTTARTFGMLSVIDETADSFVWLSENLRATTDWIEKKVRQIKSCESTSLIDPNNNFCTSLGLSQEKTSSFYRRLIRSREKPRFAINLERSKDMVSALSIALTQVADFYNATSNLRSAIIEHDADLDSASGKRVLGLKIPLQD